METLLVIELIVKMIVALDIYVCILGMQVTGTMPIYRMTCDSCNHEVRGSVVSIVLFQYATHRCDDNLV